MRASLWDGALVVNGVLEPDVETDRWRFARAAAAQAPAPGAGPEPRAVVAALMRCAEALHQQRVLEAVDALAAAGAGPEDDAPGRPTQATRLVALAEDGRRRPLPRPGRRALRHRARPRPRGGAGGRTRTVGAAGGGPAAPPEHAETWPLRSKGFRRWLARRHYQETGGAAGSQAVQDALGVLEGRALYDGEERPVAVRLAEAGGRGLPRPGRPPLAGRAGGPRGARRLAGAAPGGGRPPRRCASAARGASWPCRSPPPAASVDELRAFVNAPDDDRWRLLLAWLVAALRPRGPYPALALSGEQGSAKSTAARVLRALVDPNAAPLRAQPREPRDLMIAATNGWVVALDNLSAVPVWLSDALCRLATGGGFAVRELFSDAEEALFDAQRPVLLTGIEELATRGDLLDRALVVTLPAIPEDARRPESELWPAFEAARPRVLGALLAAVAAGLARLPETRLARLPRMADFALWVTAAEPALWPEPGAFLRAYAGNRADAREVGPGGLAPGAGPARPGGGGPVRALGGHRHRAAPAAERAGRRAHAEGGGLAQERPGAGRRPAAPGPRPARHRPGRRGGQEGAAGPDGRKRLVVLRALPARRGAPPRRRPGGGRRGTARRASANGQSRH